MTDALRFEGQAAPRGARVRPVEVVIVASGLVLIFFCFLLYGRLGDIATRQELFEDARTADVARVAQNRAVICDLQRGLGMTESRSCAEPGVEKYRDPNVRPSSTTASRAAQEARNLLCYLLATQPARGDRPVPIPPGSCSAT